MKQTFGGITVRQSNVVKRSLAMKLANTPTLEQLLMHAI